MVPVPPFTNGISIDKLGFAVNLWLQLSGFWLKLTLSLSILTPFESVHLMHTYSFHPFFTFYFPLMLIPLNDKFEPLNYVKEQPTLLNWQLDIEQYDLVVVHMVEATAI